MIKRKNNLQNARKLNQLNMAIICNDINTINELLMNNIDLNAPDLYGCYPIMLCINYGNVECLKALLQHGANPNVVEKSNGYTPLMLALAKQFVPNRYSVVMSLLKNGADVNIIGNGTTALYIARLKQPRYISILKRFGATY